jgi:hypothetical protein
MMIGGLQQQFLGILRSGNPNCKYAGPVEWWRVISMTFPSIDKSAHKGDNLLLGGDLGINRTSAASVFIRHDND